MAGPHHTAFVKQPRDPQVKSALCAQRVCAGLCRQNHATTRPSCCWPPPCAVLCVQALVRVCLRLWSLAAVGRGDTAACAGHTGAHTPSPPEIACCSTHRAEQLRCAVPGRRHSSPAWLSLHPAACHLAHFTVWCPGLPMSRACQHKPAPYTGLPPVCSPCRTHTRAGRVACLCWCARVQALQSTAAVFTNGFVFDELPLDLVKSAVHTASEAGAAICFDPGVWGQRQPPGTQTGRLHEAVAPRVPAC